MAQKKRWLMDLLKLCKFHEHMNAEVLSKSWNIPFDLAVEVIVKSVLSEKKIKFTHLENE